jgi:glycosyltransferase involved in cell wall biosynthesis
MSDSDLSVIILTYNEELHIERSIASVKPFARHIFVIDSYSTDSTVAQAEKLGAQVYQNKWTNHAIQVNWALDNLPITTKWVFRLDADEYVTPELSSEISEKMAKLPDAVNGVYLTRKVFFMGRWIRHGCYYPISFLRIWKHGHARCEERWMDEHIKLTDGDTVKFDCDFVDDNKRSLGWWTEKHNGYATREAIETLNQRYNLFTSNTVEPDLFGTQEQRKRWIKMIYINFPLFLRPFIYFSYRYFLKRGFLDGREGLVCHFLQGFWYRFLVDAKIMEISRAGGHEPAGIRRALLEIYSIKL